MKKVVSFILCLAMLFSFASVAGAEGSVYRELYSSDVSTLNYLTTGTQWDQQIAANVIDTLVEFDPHGNMIPGLAERWELSEDELTYTFHLRQGVKWYDYQGSEVADLTANDFVAAAKYVMTAANDSSTFYQMECIENASAYYNGEITDFSLVGVKAVDDHTLTYTMASPTPYFLTALTYVCYMPAYAPQLEELGDQFGTSNDRMSFCGAYILSEYEPQQKMTLVKNAANWDADQVYIDRIEYTYNAEAANLRPTMALRGETDYASLSSDILDEWKASYPQMVTQSRTSPDYSYFYCFNFDPQFDAAYEPDNWLIAVNNENFRHSIMSAFDRVYAMSALDPDAPGSTAQTSVTPRTFCSVDGVDFADLPAWDGIKDYFYNEEKAVEYKAKAIEELTAAGATFPVKMLISYRSDMSDWERESILVKQQIEGVLGTDYIQCELYAAPTSNFLSNIRRGGNYAFMRCNWGADYIDPQTWTDPFVPKIDAETGKYAGNSYNKMDKMLDSDFEQTKAVLTSYYAGVEAAKAVTSDMKARYEAFAEAESILVKNALIIPYYISPAEYRATKLNIFEGQYASCGISILRFKGQKVYDDFLTPEQREASYQEWAANLGK